MPWPGGRLAYVADSLTDYVRRYDVNEQASRKKAQNVIGADLQWPGQYAPDYNSANSAIIFLPCIF
jgi:hypothetical protein